MLSAITIICIVVTWVILSLVCSITPISLPTTIPRGSTSPLLLAHRGSISSDVPENTLQAFSNALLLGTDVLETDAHLTRDQHIVLSHNDVPKLANGKNAPQSIRDATLEEIRHWDLGGGHHIPTLTEALEAFPTARFNVDLKSMHTEAPRRLLEVIRDTKASNRVLVTSFSEHTLHTIRELGYEGQTGTSQAEAFRLLLLSKTKLRELGLPRGSVVQIPHTAYGINFARQAIIDKCHSLGVKVHYWLVNDPTLATRLLKLGADGIITDKLHTVGPVVLGHHNQVV